LALGHRLLDRGLQRYRIGDFWREGCTDPRRDARRDAEGNAGKEQRTGGIDKHRRHAYLKGRRGDVARNL